MAGDTKLDRRDVLAFLSNPPPGLDKLDLGLEDRQRETGRIVESEMAEGVKPVLEKPEVPRVGKVKENQEKEEDGPWNPSVQQRRLEKKKLSREVEETLEKVYRRTKYPTVSFCTACSFDEPLP